MPSYKDYIFFIFLRNVLDYIKCIFINVELSKIGGEEKMIHQIGGWRCDQGSNET